MAERTERLDQLVHCAVRAIPRPALDCDADDFTAAVNLNGTALLYLVQAADPLLVRDSTVFFLTSRGGRTVVPNYAAIGVAKALAESLVRYLASELAPRGVRINTIAPGVVETDALRALFGEQAAEIARHAAETNPSGRGVQRRGLHQRDPLPREPRGRVRPGADHLRQRRPLPGGVEPRLQPSRSISVALAMPPLSHMV